MDTINARIAILIGKSGKTKTEWARRLNVTPQFISSICNGKKAPSARTVADICREFHVNEDWLRTGEGDWPVKKAPQSLDELLSVLLNGQTVTDEDRILVKNFLELPGTSRKAVIEFVQKCVVDLSAGREKGTAPVGPPDIMSELAELKRQNQELAAEIAAMKEEDAILYGETSGGTKTG